jgi:hypothetical protein
MDVRPRHVAVVLGLAIVILPALSVLIEAAGKGLALAVSVARRGPPPEAKRPPAALRTRF